MTQRQLTAFNLDADNAGLENDGKISRDKKRQRLNYEQVSHDDMRKH